VAMEAFIFSSPLCTAGVHLVQASTGTIGAKVYPGALLMAAVLERGLIAPLAGRLVLEVGAGACPIPSLLAAALGSTAIATDLEGSVLDLTRVNLARARQEGGGGAGAAHVCALPWGSMEAAGSALALARSLCPGAGLLVLGADVVYHEHLVAPLITTLSALAGRASGQIVTVVLTYVQRFKRAKRFFKLARKAGFSVEQRALGLVVDYDALSWSLPTLTAALIRDSAAAPTGPTAAAGAEGGAAVAPPLVLRSDGSSYAGYCRTLVEAAAACVRQGGIGARWAGEGADGSAHAAHGVDSDSGDEWADSAGYASRLLSSLSGMAMAETHDAEEEEGTAGGQEKGGGELFSPEPGLLADHAEPAAELVRAAQRAAHALAVPMASPLKAYLITLTMSA
jgi:hypothetical protein